MAVKVKQHKGKWWIFIDYKGKRKAKCVGDSKRAAQHVAEKIQAKISLGQFEITDEKQHRPFETYFRNWLDTYVKAHCKERTYWLYEAALRLYLLPAFGQKDIGEIHREEVKALAYGLLAQGKRRSTVNNVLAPLSGMFNQAIEDGYLSASPTMRILRRTRTADVTARRQSDFLTREELGLLLRTCQEHFATFYPFISLLARTGLRLGEAIALQWDDLDWHSRFIEVRRSSRKADSPPPRVAKPAVWICLDNSRRHLRICS